MPVLSGKVAVITGGTRGLGLAIASAFAVEGAAVVVGSRSPAAVAAAVEQLQAQGTRAGGLPVDVSRLAEVQALAAHALDTFGRIDVWVNNAGITGPYGPTLGLAPEAFQQVMSVNMLGTYYGSRTALSHFLTRRFGKLINLLGFGYNRPAPFQNAYGSSKSWVRAFTLALAKETVGSGVGIFAFLPGMVLTEMLTELEVIQGSEPRLKIYPAVLRILAQPPEKAARKAVWIASPATDGKTGLVVRAVSNWQMLGRLLREITLTKAQRASLTPELHIHSIPPAT